MKKILFFILVFVNSHAQDFQVGAFQLTINPEKDTLYMAGGKPNRPFINIHDSLYVKTMFIENKDENLTILTFDCIGMLYPVLQEIRAEIAKIQPEINTKNIVMSSTHTHSGPDVVGIWGKDLMHSGVVAAYMNKIIHQAVESILQAYKHRKPAKMEYAIGKHGDDWVMNISEPNEIDRDLNCIRFIDLEGNNLVTLTNFACHPTILDDAIDAASSDYLWGYYNYLDQIQGGVNMFIQGAIGGWVQPEEIKSSYENAQFYGERMGKEVYNLLKTAKLNQREELSFNSKMVDFPVTNSNFIKLSEIGTIKRKFESTVLSELVFFKIGEAEFASHPGESVPKMSFETKKMMKTNGPKFVMGLTQDALGYILKPSFFQKNSPIPHSAYLTSMSIGPETMQIILNTLHELKFK